MGAMGVREYLAASAVHQDWTYGDGETEGTLDIALRHNDLQSLRSEAEDWNPLPRRTLMMQIVRDTRSSLALDSAKQVLSRIIIVVNGISKGGEQRSMGEWNQSSTITLHGEFLKLDRCPPGMLCSQLL